MIHVLVKQIIMIIYQMKLVKNVILDVILVALILINAIRVLILQEMINKIVFVRIPFMKFKIKQCVKNVFPLVSTVHQIQSASHVYMKDNLIEIVSLLVLVKMDIMKIKILKIV